MAFLPLLSEFDEFPIDPDVDTLENCLANVRNDADLFVLIVGSRYGYVDASKSKSITNLEYEEARAKGIPIFVFVKTEVIGLLPIWRDNPDADYSNVVDSPKLLQFVSELRDGGNIWVHEFDSSGDIEKILKNRLSTLFYDSLKLRRKLRGKNEAISNLAPRALQVYVNKPERWKLLLLAELLEDCIRQRSQKRLDVEFGISIGSAITFQTKSETIDWCRQKLADVTSLSNSMNSIFRGGNFQIALDDTDEQASVERFSHMASRYGEVYEKFLDWKSEFRRVVTPIGYKPTVECLSRFSDTIIADIEEYASTIAAKTRESPEAPEGNTTPNINLTLKTKTDPDALASFMNEISKLE